MFFGTKFNSVRCLLYLPKKNFSSKKMNKLVWVDCEMTGLDVNREQLLEIALVITDPNFKKVC